MLNLTGTVAGVTKARLGFGVIRLDEPYQGRKYASICPETKGRMEVVNRTGGVLVVGSKITVVEAYVGSEALLAKQIK